MKIPEFVIVAVAFVTLGLFAIATQNFLFKERVNFGVCPLCGKQ